MRVKASVQGDIVTVQLFLSHPMTPGRLCGADVGAADFIQELEVRYDGERIFSADLSDALSRDPFMRFRFQGARGGRLEVLWRDNQGRDRQEVHSL